MASRSSVYCFVVRAWMLTSAFVGPSQEQQQAKIWRRLDIGPVAALGSRP